MSVDDRPGAATVAKATEVAEGAESERTMFVAGGRTVTSTGDVLELRSPSGMLELSIRLTEAGPVLQVEAMKVAIKAADTVSIDCKTFEVRAQDQVKLHADGELHMTSEKEMKITSPEDVRVLGKIIYLN